MEGRGDHGSIPAAPEGVGGEGGEGEGGEGRGGEGGSGGAGEVSATIVTAYYEVPSKFGAMAYREWMGNMLLNVQVGVHACF